MDLLAPILFLVLCGGLSFLFSGIEAGFLALNPVRIRRLAHSNYSAAKALKSHLDDPDPFLWTILIGNTVANFGLVGCFVVLMQQLQPLPLLVRLGLCLVAFFGFYTLLDLLPKMLVRRFPNRITIFLTYPFELFYAILSPLVSLVSRLTPKSHSPQSKHPAYKTPFQNRDDLRKIMQESASSLTIDERTLIARVMALQDRTVQTLMNGFDPALSVTPKHSIKEAAAVCHTKSRSRILIRSNRSGKWSTVGIFNLKQILYTENINSSEPIQKFTVPVTILRAETTLDDALQQMKATGQRLAIVVDSQQREVGVVSINDILRSIFSEMNL